MEIINKILEWPVIVQGILGSAFFWLIIHLGQKITTFFTNRAKKFRDRIQEHNICHEYIRRKWLLMPDYAPAGFGYCIYYSIHFIVRGLILIILAQLFLRYIYVFSIVGYLGALFYFFRAAVWVTNLEDSLTPVEHWERVAELEKELFGEVRKETLKKIEMEKEIARKKDKKL